MSFTQDDVKKLAYLARLALNENSVNSIAQDLNNILHMVDQINEINVESIKPMEHSLDITERCREDEVTESDVRDLMQQLISEDAKAAGLYLVPKVVDQE